MAGWAHRKVPVGGRRATHPPAHWGGRAAPSVFVTKIQTLYLTPLASSSFHRCVRLSPHGLLRGLSPLAVCRPSLRCPWPLRSGTPNEPWSSHTCWLATTETPRHSCLPGQSHLESEMDPPPTHTPAWQPAVLAVGVEALPQALGLVTASGGQLGCDGAPGVLGGAIGLPLHVLHGGCWLSGCT